MPKSPYLANLTLDALIGLNGAAVLVPPSTLYVALFTVQPTDVSSGTEVSGGSYARLGIANVPANFTAAASRSKSNAADLAFPTATGSWGTIVGYALFDAPTGGNMLYRGTLLGPVTITTGDVLSIRTGQLTITEN
jgi:hypothetical protein